MSETAAGATLEATEITPCPPRAIIGSVIGSSPERMANLSSQRLFMSLTMFIESVDSLTPTMLGSSARRSSSSVMAGVSPVVPQGTRPWMPPWIWNSTMPSRASTSTFPFLKGVTRAVNAPLNISLLQLEVPVQNSYCFFYPSRRQYASHLYLRGGDEPYRDTGLPERREHSRRVTWAVEHPRPHDRDLTKLLLALDTPV